MRVYCALFALASLALLADAFIKAVGPTGTDFLAFWGAGRMALAGDPAAAYDLAVQERVQTATGSEGWFAFVNPPPFLLFTAPFATLGLPLAWLAWVGLGWALFAVVATSTYPRLWPLAAVFPGALLAASHAQTGLLTGALLIGGVVLLDRRPLIAGALLGALIIKPHLALLVPLWLAAGSRWQALRAMAASAAGLLALSWAIFGTQTFAAYPAAWEASAAIVSGAGPELHLRMASFYAQFCLFMPPGAALGLHGIVALLAATAVATGWRRCGKDGIATGALMLAASGLASPYLFNYDLPFLLLPILWLVAQGCTHGFRRAERAALVMLWLAPFATRAAALPLGLNLMPAASALLLWLVWSRACCSRATGCKFYDRDGSGGEQGGNPAADCALSSTTR